MERASWRLIIFHNLVRSILNVLAEINQPIASNKEHPDNDEFHRIHSTTFKTMRVRLSPLSQYVSCPRVFEPNSLSAHHTGSQTLLLINYPPTPLLLFLHCLPNPPRTGPRPPTRPCRVPRSAFFLRMVGNLRYASCMSEHLARVPRLSTRSTLTTKTIPASCSWRFTRTWLGYVKTKPFGKCLPGGKSGSRI